MKRKILMVSAFVLAIGGAFATKETKPRIVTAYFVNPGCTPISDCQGGTITCLQHFSDAQCLHAVSPKRN